MAVSKIAVMALVGILAVPILLGYALNLSEVTETDYKPDGESVNVTQLLQNDTGYSYTYADLYSLNTSFTQGVQKASIQPLYNVSNAKTSFKMFQLNLNPGQFPADRNTLSTYAYYYVQSNYSGSGDYLYLQVFNPNSDDIMLTVTRVHTVLWDRLTSKLDYTYYNSSSPDTLMSQSVTISNHESTFRLISGGSNYNSPGYQQVVWDRAGWAEINTYADYSKGYRFNGLISNVMDSIIVNNSIHLSLPDHTRNALMTIDLGSITDANYTFNINVSDRFHPTDFIGVVKTTDSDGVHWGLYRGHSSGNYIVFNEKITDLYYDSARTSNTYQLNFGIKSCEFRYVGDWPSIIGPANYYLTYDYPYMFDVYDELVDVSIGSNSPKMRVDSAEYRAFEYPIINNVSYNPSDFKTNPSTEIKDIIFYGESLVFGGNTYTVTNGNIMIGTHKVPVNGMVLDSVPTPNAITWNNRINGTVVSVTAEPSNIQFNGKWGATISTIGNVATTYTKTEWVAGEFAWNGIDTNFLIVGLITSLGVFIALGIYARRSGKALIPLLIVCGGAIALFICMI